MSIKDKSCIKSNTVEQKIFKQGLKMWVEFVLLKVLEHKEEAGPDREEKW